MLSEYMLNRQRIKNGIISAPEKQKPKPIAKRSPKMKAVIAELKKLYPIFLKARPLCEIKSEVCTHKATVVHHTAGRGANVLNQTTWKASCAPCNGFVENKDAWARDNGHKVSRHTK